MKIKNVENQIQALEEKMYHDQLKMVETRTVIFGQGTSSHSYIWFLLPIAGFMLGYKKNMTIITLATGFIRMHMLNWIRHQANSLVTHILLKQ